MNNINKTLKKSLKPYMLFRTISKNGKVNTKIGPSFSTILILLLVPLFLPTNGYTKDMPPETVSLSSITILNRLSNENKFFTIDKKVRTDVPYYRFSITSPHGDYNVSSIKDLLKVCHEIRTIEEFRATDEGGQAWDSAGESLKNIGRGAKQIVKHPKESAKAFARAGGKLLRGIGRFLKKKVGKKDKEEISGDGTDRSVGGKGVFAGKHARQFAAELGLDVYTDNPYAQILIQEVAKQRAKGSIGTSVGLFFLAPVAGLGLLSNSLTPDGLNAETEKLILGESPPELKHVLTKKYDKELGLKYEKKSPLALLLGNPNYTPREQAYLYLYLKQLGGPDNGWTAVEGLKDAVKHLGKADTPDKATFAINQMELLYAYQKHAKDLTKFVVVSDMIGALKGKKQLLIIIPYDIVGNTPQMHKFLNKVVKAAKKNGVKGKQLWFTGNVMSGFKATARGKGVTVKENALKLPHFAPKEAAGKS